VTHLPSKELQASRWRDGRSTADRLFIVGLERADVDGVIHKPMQAYWLAAIFGGYDMARVWHFWLMWLFVLFVIPHVVLVLVDGWDTLRSMIVGWSMKIKNSKDIYDEY